jgi:drug/metabolite transporter (DMT)-like permease
MRARTDITGAGGGANRLEAAAFVGLLGAAWGSGYILIKVALEDFTPVEISSARVGLGAVVLLALVRLDPRERPPRIPRGARQWTLLLALALLTNVVPYTLTAWGVTEMPTTAAAITNATTPLFTAALAIVLSREARPSLPRTAGVLLGFAGVVVMFGFGFAGGSAPARLALIAAAVSYALAFVLAAEGDLADFSPAWLSAMQLSLAAALMLPATLAAGAAHAQAPSLGPFAALLALGIVTTGLATILYYRAVRRIGATSASLSTYVVPVVGAALGFVFLDESLGVLVVVGAVITAVGIALAERDRHGVRTLAAERIA